jgi:putative heme-binding domain-containing protein
VFDPSLVIGPSYQAVTVVTTKGRSLTGLLVEDSPTRVVMKVQGGKQEIIPRSEVEEQSLSKMSLMPEDVEKQLKAQEIADLFSFLVLDKPPSDPNARRVPGTPKGL